MQHDLASMIKEKSCSSWISTEPLLWEVNFSRVRQTFLYTVKENGGIFRFLTNNSSKAARDYVEQFHDWGIETTEEEFITAGTYARDFLKKYYENEKILVAATETYCNELRKAGLNITDQAEDDVDCVLCAYDTELTYEKLVQVCKQLTETKVPWFATNPDLRCPIDFGMVPDCGSICRMITASVGKNRNTSANRHPEWYMPVWKKQDALRNRPCSLVTESTQIWNAANVQELTAVWY